MLLYVNMYITLLAPPTSTTCIIYWLFIITSTNTTAACIQHRITIQSPLYNQPLHLHPLQGQHRREAPKPIPIAATPLPRPTRPPPTERHGAVRLRAHRGRRAVGAPHLQPRLKPHVHRDRGVWLSGKVEDAWGGYFEGWGGGADSGQGAGVYAQHGHVLWGGEALLGGWGGLVLNI